MARVKKNINNLNNLLGTEQITLVYKTDNVICSLTVSEVVRLVSGVALDTDEKTVTIFHVNGTLTIDMKNVKDVSVDNEDWRQTSDDMVVWLGCRLNKGLCDFNDTLKATHQPCVHNDFVHFTVFEGMYPVLSLSYRLLGNKTVSQLEVSVDSTGMISNDQLRERLALFSDVLFVAEWAGCVDGQGVYPKDDFGFR